METRKLVLWIIIGVLFVAVLYTIFGVSVSAGGVATQSAQVASSYSGMVGGC